MANPHPESELEQQESTKRQQNIDKKKLLLLTKRRERRKLDAEIEEIEFDLLLYGDKE